MTMNRKILTALVYYPACILLSIVVVNSYFIYQSNSIKDYVSGSVLLNGDFEKGFQNWSKDSNVSITNINNKNYVHVEKNDKGQTRFYQNISLSSNNEYRLSFRLNGNQSGVFITYRDITLNESKYLWCDGNEEVKIYTWDIKAQESGKQRIYFTTFKRGNYYFSDISLCNKNNKYWTRIVILVTFILTISIILFGELFFCLVLSNRLNFILSSVILLLMIIPILKISREKISINENRNLAEFKPLISKGKINTCFGNDFNEWINDRFFGRSSWMTLNRYIQKFFDKRIENNYAFQGKDGWLFSKTDYHDKDYIKTCEKIRENIALLTDYFNRKGIKIYFAIMPEKECQYSEKHYIRKFDKEKIPDYLSKICTNNFIYLKDCIEKYKKDGYTHFKEDHHWTHLGAFGGYQGIMNMIKKDFDVSILDKEDFIINELKGVYDNQVRIRFLQNKIKNGSTYDSLNLNNNLYKYSNKYYVFTPQKKPLQKEVGDRYATFVGNLNKYRIMIIGDSNIGYILPFFTPSFTNSLFLYASGSATQSPSWSIRVYYNIISNFKPQIIVVLVRGADASSWQKLY